MSQISTESDDLERVGLHVGNGRAPERAAARPRQAAVHRWSDLTDQQKRIAVVAVVVHAMVAGFTVRDLRRRPAQAVRGPKALWAVWAMLNTTGSIAYWLCGRRRPA